MVIVCYAQRKRKGRAHGALIDFYIYIVIGNRKRHKIGPGKGLRAAMFNVLFRCPEIEVLGVLSAFEVQHMHIVCVCIR